MENRRWISAELTRLGFTLTDSSTNFLFAAHPALPGETLYRKLKERGVLIRHFTLDRIRDYNRITVGTREQMEILLAEISRILQEAK